MSSTSIQISLDPSLHHQLDIRAPFATVSQVTSTSVGFEKPQLESVNSPAPIPSKIPLRIAEALHKYTLVGDG